MTAQFCRESTNTRGHRPRLQVFYSDSCEGGAFEESAGSGFTFELAVLHENLSTDDNGFRNTADAAALISTVVHAHVMGAGADRLLPIRIENHNVGVGPDR